MTDTLAATETTTETTAELRARIIRHREIAGRAAGLSDDDAQAWHLSWAHGAEGGLPVYEERDRLREAVAWWRDRCASCLREPGSGGVL